MIISCDVGLSSHLVETCSYLYMSPVGAYDPDQPGSGFLDILKGGTERFLTNIKDTSSKVIQSVARYRAPICFAPLFFFCTASFPLILSDCIQIK